MNKLNEDVAKGAPQTIPPDSPLSKILKPISRRDFLGLSGIVGVGTLGLMLPDFIRAQIVAASPASEPAGGTSNPFPPDAKGMIIAQPTRCTGCRRCELACTEFNDGKAAPSLARIKVARNLNFGPTGAQLGFWRGNGQFGNFLVVQDTCRQCAHPVPCQLACPAGAIEVVEPVNARVVNTSKCTGCRICQEACPWAMTSFDEELKKATKCTLCNGNPECVKACPTGALQYVPWQNRGKDIPTRWVVPASITMPADVAGTCSSCHK